MKFIKNICVVMVAALSVATIHSATIQEFKSALERYVQSGNTDLAAAQTAVANYNDFKIKRMKAEQNAADSLLKQKSFPDINALKASIATRQAALQAQQVQAQQLPAQQAAAALKLQQDQQAAVALKAQQDQQARQLAEQQQREQQELLEKERREREVLRLQQEKDAEAARLQLERETIRLNELERARNEELALALAQQRLQDEANRKTSEAPAKPAVAPKPAGWRLFGRPSSVEQPVVTEATVSKTKPVPAPRSRPAQQFTVQAGTTIPSTKPLVAERSSRENQASLESLPVRGFVEAGDRTIPQEAQRVRHSVPAPRSALQEQYQQQAKDSLNEAEKGLALFLDPAFTEAAQALVQDIVKPQPSTFAIDDAAVKAFTQEVQKSHKDLQAQFGLYNNTAQALKAAAKKSLDAEAQLLGAERISEIEAVNGQGVVKPADSRKIEAAIRRSEQAKKELVALQVRQAQETVLLANRAFRALGAQLKLDDAQVAAIINNLKKQDHGNARFPGQLPIKVKLQLDMLNKQWNIASDRLSEMAQSTNSQLKALGSDLANQHLILAKELAHPIYDILATMASQYAAEWSRLKGPAETVANSIAQAEAELEQEAVANPAYKPLVIQLNHIGNRTSTPLDSRVKRIYNLLAGRTSTNKRADSEYRAYVSVKDKAQAEQREEMFARAASEEESEQAAKALARSQRQLEEFRAKGGIPALSRELSGYPAVTSDATSSSVQVPQIEQERARLVRDISLLNKEADRLDEEARKLSVKGRFSEGLQISSEGKKQGLADVQNAEVMKANAAKLREHANSLKSELRELRVNELRSELATNLGVKKSKPAKPAITPEDRDKLAELKQLAAVAGVGAVGAAGMEAARSEAQRKPKDDNNVASPSYSPEGDVEPTNNAASSSSNTPSGPKFIDQEYDQMMAAQRVNSGKIAELAQQFEPGTQEKVDRYNNAASYFDNSYQELTAKARQAELNAKSALNSVSRGIAANEAKALKQQAAAAAANAADLKAAARLTVEKKPLSNPQRIGGLTRAAQQGLAAAKRLPK